MSEEDRALNRELGSFGLEPPKIYKSGREEYDYSQTDPDFLNLRSFSNERRDSRSGAQRQREREGSSRKGERAPKKTNTRKKSKLRRKIIFYGALGVSLAALVVVLSLTVLFKIHNITVTGNEVYSQKEIMAVLPVEKEENLFLVDKKGAAQKVKENLPYVYEVKIKRKLPSTIAVTITETPQVYCVLNGDKSYTYLDDTFKVLEDHGGSVPEGAIVINDVKLKTAIKGQKAAFAGKKTAKNLKKLTDVIKKMELTDITAISTKDVNNNYLVYQGRLTFKLGNLDNLERKIYAALTATEKLNESNPEAKGTMTASNDKQIYFTAE